MRVTATSFLIALILVCSSASYAHGAVVTIGFSGTITSAYQFVDLDPSTTLPGWNGEPNQAYSGSITFDDQASATDYVGIGQNYQWPIGTVSVNFGGYQYSYLAYSPRDNDQITVPTTDFGIGIEGALSFQGQNGTAGGTFSQLNYVALALGTNLPTLALSDIKNLSLDNFITSPGASGISFGEQFYPGTVRSGYNFGGTISAIDYISAVSANVLAATGTFANGAILGGALAINSAIGLATSSDLSVTLPNSAGVEVFHTITSQGTTPDNYYGVILLSDDGQYNLSLAVNAATLVGYNGGALISTTFNPNSGTSSSYESVSDPALTSGALTASVTSVPEPSSLLLCGIASIVGLGAMRRRR